MKRLIWVDGRLSWWLVLAAAYVSCSVIAADYFWRLLVMPFENLLTDWVIGNLAVILLLIAYRHFHR